MSKDLTVIILSFNTRQITEKCLARVYESKTFSELTLKNSVRVAVVDNGSSDGSVEMIRSKFSWVKLLALPKNLGFARGNNLAMKIAETPYILLLNSDTFLERQTIARALIYLESHKKCDVLSLSLVYPDAGFQPSGGFLPTPFKTILWLLGFESIPLVKKLLHPIYIYDRSFFAKERHLEWASGAFFLLRRHVYQETGGFDEKLFMYYEDVEWCKRIKDQKMSICFTPSLKVVHIGGASGRQSSYQILLRKQFENILYFHQKHFPRQLFLVKAVSILGFWLRSMIYFTRSREKWMNTNLY